MAHSIALPEGYENVLLEAYRKESLTSVLESSAPTGNIAQMEQMGTFYYPMYSTGGLGDVRDNGRLPSNSGVSLTWEPVPGNYDRGTILEIDEKTDSESFNLAFGQAANHLNRFKVVPEGDAFVFSQICGNANITKETPTTFDSGADMLKAINAAATKMDEKEVPEEGRVLFITPTLLNSVKDLDTTKSREALSAFSSIQKVPQSRFYTAIDMLDGVTKDEEIGHYRRAEDRYEASKDTTVTSGKNYYTKSGDTYTKVTSPTGNPSTSSYYELVATAAKDMNFMIAHKSAVILRWKFARGNVISPDDNQQGYGYLYKYRKYGVCDVRKNLGHYITMSHKA